VRKQFEIRWTIFGTFALGAVAVGVATYLLLDIDQFASVDNRSKDGVRSEATVSRPNEIAVARMVDGRTLEFASTGNEFPMIDTNIDSPPVENSSSISLPVAENEAAANLFGAKSLAIVPEKWPRARMKYVIGATAMVHEAQSELEFQARVDTGARSCSLHVEEFVIDDEAETMNDNIGKEIRIKVTNHLGASQWIKSIVDCCTHVRTSDHIEERYKVPVSFRWNDFERIVLVTLNNRAKMNYPLLLGRNFLQSDFVVDVALDGDL
jgi:hypothetical protein